MPPRAAKILVVVACSLGLASVAFGQSLSVNYRGQQQEDLTCMQASTLVGGETVVFRNDPSTNCFGFPSIQFDTLPVEGGKPNGLTIDWSLMVDELQMEDDDRLHIHLPGFTGAMNTFGIMSPAIDTSIGGALYTPNFKSEFVTGDVTDSGERADFGALVGIWGISCGTEENLYMDRAKVDNLRTAEWDPATEMLKVVIKGQRFGPSGATGRHDGLTGVTGATSAWVGSSTTQGQSIPFSSTTTLTPFTATTVNRNSARGAHLQAMEYSREGPSRANGRIGVRDGSRSDELISGSSAATSTAIDAATSVTYGTDGLIPAPGHRVCGIYVDPTKLYRGQKASNIQNGLGPLPPFGGIGKNWYKLAFIRRFRRDLCSGGFTRSGKVTRPGMTPEACTPVKTRNPASLATFWQVPFDGDTERVVGFQFTTTKQMLPVNKGDSPAGVLTAPTFSYASAKGKTTGPNKDNCITVSLIPTVTMVSGTSGSEITINGLTGSGTSSSDQLPLYSDSSCTSRFTALVGSNGAPIKSFAPVKGTGSAADPSLKQSYRPFGQGNVKADGTFNSVHLDDVDWHTRANRGTMSGLTTGDPLKDSVLAGRYGGAAYNATGRGDLSGVKGVLAGSVTGGFGAKLSSPEGDLVNADGNARFNKDLGTLAVKITPGYFLQKGELLVFSFLLQNSAAVTPSKALTVSATGSYCDSDEAFCDGDADQPLAIDGVPIVDKGKLLQTEAPSFSKSKIFQSSSDPDSLTTIFVTLQTNVDLNKPDASSESKITISGLCGFASGSNLVLFQNQKSGGMPFENKYPTEAVRSVNDMPGLSADDNKHIAKDADYDGALGQLKINLGNTGFLEGVDYAFAFQLLTQKTANAACTPRISSAGGNNAIAEGDFKSATNVGKVDAPQFTTIKIGQVTTRPDVMNFLCVTLKHNYEFHTDAASSAGTAQQQAGYVESKITISGLTGTQAVSSNVGGRGFALAYCPTELPYFDDSTMQHTGSQFQPPLNNAEATFTTQSTRFAVKRFRTDSFSDCIAPASGVGQSCVPGNPYQTAGALDRTTAGRSWFGGQVVGTDNFEWDQTLGRAILTVDAAITASVKTEPPSPKGGIPKNAEIVFALPLLNSAGASDCKAVTFEASGRISQAATPMTTTKTGRALQDGEMDGDACPLKVYAPGFHVKKITQSTAVSDEDNVFTVSLRSNVDFASTSTLVNDITITGLTGSATGNNDDLGIKVPNWKFSPSFENGVGKWVQSTGTLTLRLATGLCSPPTVYAAGPFYSKASSSVVQAPFAVGGTDQTGLTTQASTPVTGTTVVTGPVTDKGLLGIPKPSSCIKAGYLYVFTFQLKNPDTEQAAPTVQIGGRATDSDNNEIVVPAAAIDKPIKGDEDKVPMFISDQVLTTFKIGQLIPAPGATNVLCVTMKTSKDIKSTASEALSTVTIRGLTGFDADAQDLKLYENDGVTRITAATGNPRKGSYQVGGLIKGRNSDDGVTLGLVRYGGRDSGAVSFEIVGDTITPAGVAQFMQKNVDHKFCFRLKNPSTPMACKDVKFEVNNKNKISTVAAELDKTTTIEDYPAQSACPGYVAAPGFVIKNWRSSSNITGDVAVIHMTLASNYQLESSDKITVSGLTSYTKSCIDIPCDVGIDVTRAAVNRTFGKLYFNGVRNVKGLGSTDAGATAAERQKFAVNIQSYDLTGSKDDGTFTSTFGDVAEWGKQGDTADTASSLVFTVARSTTVDPADITTSADATLYNIVFKLTNKATATTSSAISISIGEGSVQYAATEMNTGKVQPCMGISNVGSGGMDITYTTQKTIYGGESLVLTLPKFTRDTNGMLFGITSTPSKAFETYKSWADWKAYGTDEDYARAFFTNGWSANGISAKSGDSGQTGERWNFPNVNAKVTTDADYNHDTGVLVLDSSDPGVGMNKDYWYSATENNVYEGRVTPVPYQGQTVAATGIFLNPPTTAGQRPGFVSLPEATADYYLDNGEELEPIMSAKAVPETLGAGVATNGYYRPVGFVTTALLATSVGAAGIGETAAGLNSRFNNLPAPVPTTQYLPADDTDGTPPFRGIPAKYQPSRRDNFYKGMLMKCWIGTEAPPVASGQSSIAKTDYSEDPADLGSSGVTGATMYRASGGAVTELLPPPFRSPSAAFGEALSAGITQADLTNARAFAKAGVSRILETKVIQASFRQIDYIPRKKGGCHFTSSVGANFLPVPVAGTTDQPFGQVGCQDEVPGYPAIVRLESPFSRALDPDTLCYIQRKSHVGVYTGMTAMVGENEYVIKQGAANIYTVGHVASDIDSPSGSRMTDANGDRVDRKVPRSYSTEDGGMSAAGLRGSANTKGFFKDGVGLSGQPYTIYSQLELVAKRGKSVSVGETVTISIPTSASIMPPANLGGSVTPSNADDKISHKIKISHVLIVPLSPACSIVGAYGAPSGCQAGNGKGGSFDLMLSTMWPYAYDRENGNDLTGYGMTVFGGQSTVIKTMADKHSQDLPIRPLEGAFRQSGSADSFASLDPSVGTYVLPASTTVAETGGRLQASVTGTSAEDPNQIVNLALTVVAELDAIALSSGTKRNVTATVPRLPNAPVTLIDGGCGSVLDSRAATLPYAVCLALGGGIAHNQELVQADVVGSSTRVTTTTAVNGLSRPRVNSAGTVVTGPQSITGAVGQDVTAVVSDRHSMTKTFGSAAATPNYGTRAPAVAVTTAPVLPKRSFFEEAGDSLGIGAYLLVGVYKTGTSDRYVWSTQGNKGSQSSAVPTAKDVNASLVVQRYLGTSRVAIPLDDIPAGLIGGDIANRGTGYKAPAGSVPRYQVRVAGGYSIGRFAYGVSNIMRVRSDMTSMAKPTGHAWQWKTLGTERSNSFPDLTLAGGEATQFMAVPHHVPDAAGAHMTGHSLDTTAPTPQEALVFGKATLPYPQVFHTAVHRATSAGSGQANMLSRGTCGTFGAASPVSNNAAEGCLATTFNADLPFSRNVYIEQGMDVYIVDNIFDTLIQRAEPTRKHLGMTINGKSQANLSPGWFAQTDGTSRAGSTGSAAADFFPGALTASTATPQAGLTRDVATDFVDNQRFGLIQTMGTPLVKGGFNNAGNNGASPLPRAENTGVGPTPGPDSQYGFDQDFRLYSVLGPFMRPARIKDVYDGSKIIGAAQSKFPGILTIHSSAAITNEADALRSVAIVGNGTTGGAVYPSYHNNALWSMAPVAGTTYAIAANRLTQYHKYVEADKILTFCNPLQADLNNAPGSIIMSEISDSPHSASTLLGTAYATSTSTQAVFANGRQASSNGQESSAPGVWTVPRRHSICRKMVTGNPLVTQADMEAAAAAGGSAGITAGISEARARFTESVQFNNVLNQEPSPNMRALVTFVEPTMIPVTAVAPDCAEFANGGTVVGRPAIPPNTCDGDKFVTVGVEFEVPATQGGQNCTAGAETTAKDASGNVVGTFLFPKGAKGTVLPTRALADVPKTTAAFKAAYPRVFEGVGTPELGFNVYDARIMIGDLVRANVGFLPPGQLVRYKHRATNLIPEGILTQMRDGKFVDATRRRSLLAACPEGFENRMIIVGDKIGSACECSTLANGCAETTTEFNTCESGRTGLVEWTQLLIPARTCRKEGGGRDDTGAIVGGVLGGFFGALLLALLAWFCCCRKKEQPLTARPVPQAQAREVEKPLAPVYLPQPYPALSEQFAPAPMPAYPMPGMEGVVQPTGQPTLYSSMQGLPGPMPGSMGPVGYPAPYGVVPQPAYGGY